MGVSKEAHRDSIDYALKNLAEQYRKGGFATSVKPMTGSDCYERLTIRIASNVVLFIDVYARSGSYHYRWTTNEFKQGNKKPTLIKGMKIEKSVPHSEDGVACKAMDVGCLIMEIMNGINVLVNAIDKSGMPLH